MMNNIAPASSFLHETIVKMIKMNVGMLCIRNPATIPQKSRFNSKISKENIAMKQMNNIANILGVQ